MSLLETQLPTDWSWQQISDQFRITKKPRDLVLAEQEAIPFVPMESVPSNGRDLVAYELRHPSQIASGTYFEKGDVLLSKITPSFENGKQGLALNIPGDFGLASTEIIPLQPLDKDTSARFLFYYLLHPEVRATLAAKMEGSTGRQRVPENVVRDFPFPAAPKRDQGAIAAVLRKAQRAIEIEDELIATTRELRRSTRQEVLAHGLRGERQVDSDIGPIPESWQVNPIREKAKLIAGGTPSRSVSEYWKEGTIPWVKTGQVDYCLITDTEERITNAGLANSAAKVLPEGTLLMAMYGQGVTRGRVAMLGIRAATNQACVAIIPTSDEIDSWFLYYYLSSRYDALRGLSHGANQQNLNADLVGGFRFPIADRAEQKEIIAILQAIDRKIRAHERKRKVLQDLFTALLHKLVSGEVRIADLDIDESDLVSQ